MKAMLVEVNGKRVCLAALSGRDGMSYIHGAVIWSRQDDCEIAMISVVGKSDEEPSVWPLPPIQLTDEVRIRIVETEEKSDPPIKPSTMVSPATKA
jgi:hypothetical protein